MIPNFNQPGETKGVYCAEQKKEGMIDIKSKRCIENECTVQPTFNQPGKTKGVYCAEHKKVAMICVKVKRCVENGCTVRPRFNNLSYPPIYCSQHKKGGMISQPTHRCEISKCNEIALFGYKRPQMCEKHAKPKMRNMVKRECETCYTLFVPNLDGSWMFCKPGSSLTNWQFNKEYQGVLTDRNKKTGWIVVDTTMSGTIEE